MKTSQKIAGIVLAVLLAATIYGILRTNEPSKVGPSTGKNKSAVPAVVLVDQTPLVLAQQLVQLPTSSDELPFAKEALRLAYFEVDLAYDAALRDARAHPPALSPDAKQAKARLEKAQKLVADDEAQMKQLADLLAKTKNPDRKEKVQEQLDSLEADRDLASDEADDAQQDFRREGGDLENSLQVARKQHQDAQHASPAIPDRVTAAPEQLGLYHRFEEWRQLHAVQMQLWGAKQAADNAVATLTARHNALEEKLETEKEKSAALAHHSKKQAAGAEVVPPSSDNLTAEEIAVSADRTWALASEQEALANFDKRIDTNKQLSANYGNWIDTVAARQRYLVHRALIGILIILAIAVIGIYAMAVVDHLLSRVPMDRRQMQNLRAVVHVGIRVAGLFMILLVIIGPPGQLGTFLGLAGAGLTVALKDFIVAFVGWLVLMGKNGIRLGDWVEINGVSGEVVELGMFHTVLLETGNWTDTGHPTGRRVTFTNSYAIEGHYFNFSTSGQWLWDELQVVLPPGQDPYPVIDAIHKIVSEATAESARQAEEEWQHAARTREMRSLSAAPAINVKPVAGGIELSVRYITRANERFQLRAKLYQAAVDLLGGKSVPSLPPPTAAAAAASSD